MFGYYSLYTYITVIDKFVITYFTHSYIILPNVFNEKGPKLIKGYYFYFYINVGIIL